MVYFISRNGLTKYMSDNKSRPVTKNTSAPTKSQESVSAPNRTYGGSQQAPTPTNASITQAKSRPKTD